MIFILTAKLLHLINLLCLDVQTVNGSLLFEIKEPFRMDKCVCVKVNQICEGISKNFDYPRQATQPTILICYFDKVRDHSEKSYERNVLFKRKLQERRVNVLSCYAPYLSTLNVGCGCQYQKGYCLFLTSVLVSKFKFFNITILLWKSWM